MASSYLRRQDVGKGPRPNSIGSYFFKTFEGDNLQGVIRESNTWLLNLPRMSPNWDPHLIDSELTALQIDGVIPPTYFILRITIYVNGTVGPELLDEV